MIIIQRSSAVKDYLKLARTENRSIGFVPTMGALHAGHHELLKAAALASDLTVCSIFVNPTQFNDIRDFQHYPITPVEDLRLVERTAQVLYLPRVEDLYPEGTSNLEVYDLDHLEAVYEGKYRPGHFQGVCQVMYRLLKAVQPHRLFMGQKDYQQCLVVKQLIAQLSMKTDLVIVPTVREADGLAMSSRNRRLNEEQRRKAGAIFKVLTQMKAEYGTKDLASITGNARSRLQDLGFKIDYADIANMQNLAPLRQNDTAQKAIALIAVFLGEIRLIDNMLLDR